MNEHGRFAASILDRGAKAIAAGAVGRMPEAAGLEPDADAQTNFRSLWGFTDAVADIEQRVLHLSVALAVGRPELFQQDVEWVRATYAMRGPHPDVVSTSLQYLRDELAQDLPADAGALATSYLSSALAGLDRAVDCGTSLVEADAPHVDLARRLLLAVLEARRRDAEQLVLDAFERGVPIGDLHHLVIGKVQAELGRLWQTGEVSIAAEHLGSRIAQEILALLRERMPRAARTGRSVIVASVCGDLHDIGARIVADHFEMAGWNALFLGADMPAADLVLAIDDLGGDVIALSVCRGLNVRSTAETIDRIRATHPRSAILVGGRPFTAIPELWRDVGASGCAHDAPRAVDLARRLVGG